MLYNSIVFYSKVGIYIGEFESMTEPTKMSIFNNDIENRISGLVYLRETID